MRVKHTHKKRGGEGASDHSANIMSEVENAVLFSQEKTKIKTSYLGSYCISFAILQSLSGLVVCGQHSYKHYIFRHSLVKATAISTMSKVISWRGLNTRGWLTASTSLLNHTHTVE